jgi:RNA polymerase sigma-70 factor (ECF subfamily)
MQDDRIAQKMLYDRYAPKLLSICRQYITDMYHAEDVMVMTFMKVFKNLSSFENRGNFEAWIRRIAINECISFIRTIKKVTYKDEDAWQEDYNCGFSEHTDSKLMHDDIQKLIDQLPDGCKMVFIIYAVEGYKHAEIAQMLHIAESTSKSQLAYARKLLKISIEQDKSMIHVQ